MNDVHAYDNQDRVIFARRFALWMSLGAILMMFAGFTSAYIVKKADATSWTIFSIPKVFYLSTLLIISSSITLWIGQRAFNKAKIERYRLMVGITFVLGVAFLICQVLGWFDLLNDQIFMTQQISGAFFYVISGAHALHVMGGVVILLISLLSISRKIKDPLYDLTMKVSPMRKMRVEMVATYWHFVDFLWIYLFLFLLYNHSY